MSELIKHEWVSQPQKEYKASQAKAAQPSEPVGERKDYRVVYVDHFVADSPEEAIEGVAKSINAGLIRKYSTAEAEQGEQEGTLDAAWAKHLLVSYGEVVPLGKTMFRAGWQAAQSATGPSSIESLRFAVSRLAKLTEGEARALVEVISIRLRFGHAVDIPVAATVDSRDVEIHNAAIEMAAKLADTEIELPGDMPREIEEKLRGVPLEISLRATVRSTKSSISSRIRALKRTAPKTDGGRDGK